MNKFINQKDQYQAQGRKSVYEYLMCSKFK